jgi:hypothetical protein
MEEISKKSGYAYKTTIINNQADPEGYAEVIIKNKKMIGWIKEGGNLFENGKTYEAYLTTYPDYVKWEVKEKKQEIIFKSSKSNQFSFIGTLEYIFSLRTYSNRLPFIKCGIDCGLKIIAQTDVPSNVLVEPRMWIQGAGLLYLDFLSINPSD